MMNREGHSLSLEKFTVKKDSKIAFNLVYNPKHVTMNFMLKKETNMTLPKDYNNFPVTKPKTCRASVYPIKTSKQVF